MILTLTGVGGGNVTWLDRFMGVLMPREGWQLTPVDWPVTILVILFAVMLGLGIAGWYGRDRNE